MLLEKHFRNKNYKFNKDSIKDFKRNKNKITATVDKYKVEGIFEDTVFYGKCSCNKNKCQHIYNLLYYDSLIANKEDNKKFARYKEMLIDYFYQTLDHNDIKEYKILDKVNTYSLFQLELLEDRDYMEIINMICSYNYDAGVNVGYKNLKYINIELYILIFIHLKVLILNKKYDLAFKIYKKLFKHLINFESVDILEPTIISNLENILYNILDSKRNTKEYEEFVLNLMKLAKEPYKNKLTEYIRRLVNTRFNSKKYLYLKEEMSLIYYKEAEKYKIKDYKDYSPYPLKNVSYLKEKEYWFKFHYKILNKLEYSDEEILRFLENESDFYPAKSLILKHQKEENRENLVENLKKELFDINIPFEYRLDSLKQILEHDEDFKTNPQYLEFIKQVLFKENKINDNLLNDYMAKDKEWINNNETITGIKKLNINIETKNQAIFENGDKKSLIKSLKISSFEQYLKYENYLIEDYPEETYDIFEMHLCDLIDNGLTFKELKKFFEYIDKFPKSENKKRTIRYYYDKKNKDKQQQVLM